MKPGEAVMKLTALGYRFEVGRGKVRWRWDGPGNPDPRKVRPLLEVVKNSIDEVQDFLSIFCPRCGGGCFAPDYEERPLCLACDWKELVKLYPAMAGRKH